MKPFLQETTLVKDINNGLIAVALYLHEVDSSVCRRQGKRKLS